MRNDLIYVTATVKYVTPDMIIDGLQTQLLGFLVEDVRRIKNINPNSWKEYKGESDAEDERERVYCFYNNKAICDFYDVFTRVNDDNINKGSVWCEEVYFLKDDEDISEEGFTALYGFTKDNYGKFIYLYKNQNNKLFKWNY